MGWKQQFIGFSTIVNKEVQRIFRIWRQTLLPTFITTALYFVVFGRVLGSRIHLIDGVPYLDFIAPGLVVLSVVTNSFVGSVSSLFGAKFGRHVEEVLVSPIHDMLVLFGYIFSGMVRGLLCGVLVVVVELFFTHIKTSSVFLSLIVALLASFMFSTAGVINAIYAKTFDDINLIPSFVITPLTFLGGVFYSVHSLTGIWYKISLVNPISYIVTSFRYTYLGLPDDFFGLSLVVLIAISLLLFAVARYLFKHSVGLRH